MQTTDLDDLIKTVEQIRTEQHPDLDASFLRAIIHAEKDNPEDDAAALSAIQEALKAVLLAKGLG